MQLISNNMKDDKIDCDSCQQQTNIDPELLEQLFSIDQEEEECTDSSEEDDGDDDLEEEIPS